MAGSGAAVVVALLGFALVTACLRAAWNMKACEGAVEWLALLVAAAAYVAYMDDRANDAAVLFGARLGLDPLTFPDRLRPALEALEKQGLREESQPARNSMPTKPSNAPSRPSTRGPQVPLEAMPLEGTLVGGGEQMGDVYFPVDSQKGAFCVIFKPRSDPFGDEQGVWKVSI